MAKGYQATHPKVREAAKAFTDWARFKGTTRTLFGDMVHAWTISMRNVFTPRDDDWTAREAEFSAWRERTGPEGVETAEKCLGLLMLAFMEGPGDHLGEMFQHVEANAKSLGQFFTSYHVSSFMAAMTLSATSIRDIVEERGVIEAMEPSCGAGGMVVAMGEAVKAAGYNPSRHLRVTAIDIDMIAVDMTFLQASLSGIPCFVRRANALDPDAASEYQFPNVHWVALALSESDRESGDRTDDPECPST